MAYTSISKQNKIHHFTSFLMFVYFLLIITSFLCCTIQLPIFQCCNLFLSLPQQLCRLSLNFPFWNTLLSSTTTSLQGCSSLTNEWNLFLTNTKWIYQHDYNTMAAQQLSCLPWPHQLCNHSKHGSQEHWYSSQLCLMSSIFMLQMPIWQSQASFS